jgi:uncharacterized membrane protein
MAIVTLFGFFAVLIWAVFKMTVYAVPAFVGISAGFFAERTGAGVGGAVLVGLLAAGLTLGLAQRLFAMTQGRARLAVALAFAAPAAFAGYHGAIGLTDSVESGIWRQLLAIAGAAVVGFTAATRLSDGAAVRSA